MVDNTLKCGFVAIVGRPNVGKSTLLNHLLGKKLSITSRKPQTTRDRILGIKTTERLQIIYVDTPGIHQTNQQKALNRHLNKTALSATQDVDLIVWMVEAMSLNEGDKSVFETILKRRAPLFVVVNKVDKVTDKTELLPYLQRLEELVGKAPIFLVSAKQEKGLETFEQAVIEQLPISEYFYYPENSVTDKTERFLAAERIREKLTRLLGQELPYEVAVEIQTFKKQREDLLSIDAIIWVARDGQKGIVVGEGGERLKKVGQQARLELEPLFGIKIFLRLWVKVKRNWADDERALKSLGYRDNDNDE